MVVLRTLGPNAAPTPQDGLELGRSSPWEETGVNGVGRKADDLEGVGSATQLRTM